MDSSGPLVFPGLGVVLVIRVGRLSRVMARAPERFDFNTFEVDDEGHPPPIEDQEVLQEAAAGEGTRALQREFDYQVGRRRREIVGALLKGAIAGNSKLLVAVMQMSKPEEAQGMAKLVYQGIRLQLGSGSSVHFETLPDPEDVIEAPREVRALEPGRSPPK